MGGEKKVKKINARHILHPMMLWAMEKDKEIKVWRVQGWRGGGIILNKSRNMGLLRNVFSNSSTSSAALDLWRARLW